MDLLQVEEPALRSANATTLAQELYMRRPERPRTAFLQGDVLWKCLNGTDCMQRLRVSAGQGPGQPKPLKIYI